MDVSKRKDKEIVVAVSGGFDPIHIGHVRMFERAKAMGDKLVVILNNDNWLRAKKQHVFMPDAERMEVIKAMKAVDEVVLTGHRENPAPVDATPEERARAMSVSAELAAIKPDIFANGGDRNEKNATDQRLHCITISIRAKPTVSKWFSILATAGKSNRARGSWRIT
jgi:D-beta-D-heptose 7-phosphate kinase/D-beta-D-heptose 1-phosphate adenosyltransferase